MESKKDIRYTDITDSLGAPFGGFGTGYFVFGRHGFVNWNVDGFPEAQQTGEYPRTKLWDYYAADPAEAPVALFLRKGSDTRLLQSRPSTFAEGMPCTAFSMEALMPFGWTAMTAQPETEVRMLLYSSVKPHDIDRTSIPACVMEITVCNKSGSQAEYTLGLQYDSRVFTGSGNGELLDLNQSSGQVSFGFSGGRDGKITILVPAFSERTVVGAVGWFYPRFSTPGIAPNDIIFRQKTVQNYDYEKNRGSYRRNYTLRYSSSAEVTRDALCHSEEWKNDIACWHQSLDVPADCRHVWFGSYASLITATLHTTEGYCFEIEQPHGCLNTMDVSVYSSWIFLINWPEVERRDLEQYIAVIPQTGETAGKVWHSLWADDAHYVEEAIYAIRVWRYALWSGDRKFLKDGFPSVKAALTYLYRTDGLKNLINNGGGNQSYDAWKMPGISAYVNIQWLYALFAFQKMCRMLNEPEKLCERDLKEFLPAAIHEYNENLWDEANGYWHAYRTNEQSLQLPHGNAVFSDQLFGHWAVLIDPDSRRVLEESKEKAAVKTIYKHNRIETPDGKYSCWTNGMLPEREKTVTIDITEQDPVICGYHALTCWVSTQMELASLLGYFGMEDESREVFSSVSRGMGRNVLAVGEYNRTVNNQLQAVTSWQEPGKDTPRFPPYPRYKSSWEYLISLLGMEMTMDTIRFSPFHNTSFALNRVTLAGVMFTVRVNKGWTTCYVNGKTAEPVIRRSLKEATVEFR